MGLLDSIVGQVAGSLQGSVPPGQVHPGLLDVVSSLMTQGGGLQDLVNQFESQGLGGVVASWIGTGQNLAITPEQVQSVLGDSHIAGVAAKLGLQPQDVANQLAGLLPHAVDTVTQGGVVPQGSAFDEALNLLAALRR